MDLLPMRRQNTDVNGIRLGNWTLTASAHDEAGTVAWFATARVAPLRAEVVQLWLVDLDRMRWPGLDCWAVLNAAERDRALRYHFAVDRRRFVARRAVLRQLLGNYLGQQPAAIEFVFNQFGKPSLAPEAATAGVEFNLSGARELALYAFVRERAVGVDVAQLAAAQDWELVANHFFHPAEAAEIRAQPDSERARLFLRYWTMREAFVKARGAGLSDPAAQSSFAALVRHGGGLRCEADDSHWRCISFVPQADTAAALVVNWPKNV